MGEVHLAEDTRTDERVAIKTLLPTVLDDPNRIERFQREMRLLQGLDAHPNVVPLQDVLLRPEVPRDAVVMDYIEGPSLDEVLRRGPIEISRGLRLARSMASALAHVHEHGIVHRDFKPSNVVLADDESRPVLLDFGIAKEIRPLEDLTRLTDTGQVVGTSEYMSPEQAQASPVTAKTDIFSFGVVAYQIFTGISPFRGATPAETSAKTLYHHPVPAHQQRDLVPPALSELLDRLLAKVPGDRPESMDWVVEELGRIIDDPAAMQWKPPVDRSISKKTTPSTAVRAESRSAPPNGELLPTSESTPEARRTWRLSYAGLGVLALLMLFGYLAFGYWMEESPSDPAPLPEAESPAGPLAVLPFADSGGEREGQGMVLALALAAELEEGGVPIIDPETVAAALTDLGVDLAELGQDRAGDRDRELRRLREYLDADSLLGGSLIESGGAGGLLDVESWIWDGTDGSPTALDRDSGVLPREMAERVAKQTRARWDGRTVSDLERSRAREWLPREIGARKPFALGMLALGEGRPQEASSRFQKALDLDGDSPVARLGLARALLMLRFDERARSVAEAALDSMGSEAADTALGAELEAVAAEASGSWRAAARLWKRSYDRSRDPEAGLSWVEAEGKAGGPTDALGALTVLRSSAVSEKVGPGGNLELQRTRIRWELARGRFGPALVASDALLDRARRLGARRTEALAHLHRGHALQGLSRFDSATAAVAEARDLLLEIDEPLLEAQVLTWMVILFTETGQLDSAIELGDRILDIYRRMAGSDSGAFEMLEILVEINQGRALYAAGRLTEAEPLLDRGCRVSSRVGALREAAGACVNLGATRHQMGRLESAEVAYIAALDSASRVEALDTKSIALGNLGEIEIARGRVERGLDLLHQALELETEELESIDARIYLWLQIGEARLDQDDLDKAFEAFTEIRTLATARKPPDTASIARADEVLERIREARAQQ